VKPLSICITSCNRLKYLKALLTSLEDIQGDDVQVCVVDMGSTEPGLRDYLESRNVSSFFYDSKDRDWINDEYIARNKLIEMSKNETIMFLQDDSQLIATKSVLSQAIDDFWDMEDCYCLEIYGVRKVTLRNTLDMTPRLVGKDLVDQRKYWRRSDRHFLTTGIYRKEIYDIGEYPTDWPHDKSYWGRSEDWYDGKVKEKFPNGQTYRTHVPLALSVWDDKRGGYAFIRESKRFGEYNSCFHESGLYYEKNVDSLIHESVGPVSFMEIAKPLGWSVTQDESGEQKKYPQEKIMQEGPYEDL